MQEWTVTGADRQTGKDRVLAISALTEVEASREAVLQGILVEDVRRSRTEAQDAAPSPVTRPHRLHPPRPRSGLVRSVVSAAYILITAAFLISGILAVVVGIGGGRYQPPFSERFQSDNAVGATANAVERMIYEQERTHDNRLTILIGVILIAVAMLCSIVQAIEVINDRLDRLPTATIESDQHT